MDFRLNHIALNTKDIDDSISFYEQLLEILGLYKETKRGETNMIIEPYETLIGFKKMTKLIVSIKIEML